MVRIEEGTLRALWDNLLVEIHHDVVRLEDNWPEDSSLNVSWESMVKVPKLLDAIQADAGLVLEVGRSVLMDFPVFRDLQPGIIGPEIHLVDIPPEWLTRISDLRAIDLGRLTTFEGQVRRSGQIVPRVVIAAFECKGCRGISLVKQGDQLMWQEPFRCEGNDVEGPGCGKSAGSTAFKFHRYRSILVDHQRLEVHERTDLVKAGESPKKAICEVQGDLVNVVRAGDQVQVTGILRHRERRLGNKKVQLLDTYVDVVGIAPAEADITIGDVTQSDMKTINEIAGSEDPLGWIRSRFAPSLHGLDHEKEALILQLFGGVQRTRPDGLRIRGDIHVLLIGDPGTGKSQLLRHVAEIAPHSSFAAGKGASGVGLTAAVVKDDFEKERYALQAGIMPMADGGIAVIDELDKIPEDDSSHLHPAMEQQAIYISKAGITATLPTRCAVLMAANPENGKFDVNEPALSQLALPSPLFSRFDLILPVFDDVNTERDREKARHIISAHGHGSDHLLSSRVLDPDLIRRYLIVAKEISPVLRPEVQDFLVDFYSDLRGTADTANASPITARQLEALIRLSQASARIRLSNEVELKDAEVALKLMQTYMVRINGSSWAMDSLWTRGSRAMIATVDKGSETTLEKTPGVVQEQTEPTEQLVTLEEPEPEPISRKVTRGSVIIMVDRLSPIGGVSRTRILAEATADGFDPEIVGQYIDALLAEGKLMDTEYGLRTP